MTTRQTAGALIRATRPRQWLKNLLVLAAPLAAGVLGERDALLAVVVAFTAFTLSAGGIYLVNDVADVESDRRHPHKRSRPVASGEVSARQALSLAMPLLVVGVALGFAGGWRLGVTISIYVVLQLAYARWLKDEVVIDLAVVAAGFLLRAIAGGVAAEVPLSQWFLLVASFGSLFMVAGKRYSEMHSVGPDALTRRSLARYSDSYLRFVWSLAAAVAVTAYSLWAFEIGGDGPVHWQAISIAPFVVGLLRYAVDIDRGLAGEPEDAVLRDRVLLGLVGVWITLFALGVYAS